ncbi:hypothetical protein HQ560_02645, partial [bacterium]|nr:hypothetical protein [bacterium]
VLLVTIGLAAAPARAATSAETPLGFVAAGKEYRFDTGELAGTLRLKGKSLGLTPVRHKTTGVAIAGRHGLVSHYRLLTADDRFGTGAWDWPSAARLLPDGAVEARWSHDDAHPLDMTATYRWRTPNTLDVTTTVTAGQDLRRLEVFLASYFSGFAEPKVYTKQGFLPATRAEGVWHMFPRDAAAVQTIQDGRWKRPPHPVDWVIRPHLAAPLALRRDAKTGLVGVIMARPGDCFAIATPHAGEGHRSLYLSLLGRDLKTGESATAHARLLIAHGLTDDQAVAHYETFKKETTP